MKPSIVTYAVIFGLSQLFAFQALATENKSLCYSTGPLENASAIGAQSVEVFVKVLNNGKRNIKAKVLVFGLDGMKDLVDEVRFNVGGKSSGFFTGGVDGTVEFEVQVKLSGQAPNKVLLGAFGKKLNTDLVAAHRLVHTEWTPISCKDFN